MEEVRDKKDNTERLNIRGNPEDGAEYVYILDMAWRPNSLKSHAVRVDIRAVDVKKTLGEYEFTDKDTGERWRTSYPWSLVKATPENLERLKAYRRARREIELLEEAAKCIRDTVEDLRERYGTPEYWIVCAAEPGSGPSSWIKPAKGDHPCPSSLSGPFSSEYTAKLQRDHPCPSSLSGPFSSEYTVKLQKPPDGSEMVALRRGDRGGTATATIAYRRGGRWKAEKEVEWADSPEWGSDAINQSKL